MRSVRFTEFGGPEVLSIERIDRPEPTANEVLVETKTIGVNPSDVVTRRGVRPGTPATPDAPMTLGADFAGSIVDVGEKVDAFTPGDRVAGTGMQGYRGGTYAEYVVAPATHIAKLPAAVSYDAGGAIGVVGVTAWQGLIEYAQLRPDETCFIHGGSGGTGHLAIELANAFGATVITTVGSSTAQRFVSESGATHVLRYQDEQLLSTLQDTAPNGVDVVFDHRLGEYLQFDIDTGASRILGIGSPEDTCEIRDLWPAFSSDVQLQIFSMTNIPYIDRLLAKVLNLLEHGDITVSVDRSYPLAEAAEAHRALETDRILGKVILRP